MHAPSTQASRSTPSSSDCKRKRPTYLMKRVLLCGDWVEVDVRGDA